MPGLTWQWCSRIAFLDYCQYEGDVFLIRTPPMSVEKKKHARPLRHLSVGTVAGMRGCAFRYNIIGPATLRRFIIKLLLTCFDWARDHLWANAGPPQRCAKGAENLR